MSFVDAKFIRASCRLLLGLGEDYRKNTETKILISEKVERVCRKSTEYCKATFLQLKGKLI